MDEVAQQPQQETKLPKREVVPPAQSVESAVQKWTRRIRQAKEKREKDFKRMREDMEFIGGVQWPDQDDICDDRYIANVTLREVNQAVSALYARNPKAIARRRERLDYALWDGKPETLMLAAQTMMMNPGDPSAMALIMDYQQGQQMRALIDQIARTLEIAYQIQIDRQEPDFKLQMKQLVRRVKVCGVGFVRVSFKREGRQSLEPGQTAVPIGDRMKRITALVEDYDKGNIDDNSDKVEQLKMLLNSVSYSLTNRSEVEQQSERLVFDFPQATSVIVDPRCRIMKGFVGAQWVVQEYILPIAEAKAFFEKPDLRVGPAEGAVKTYSAAGDEKPAPDALAPESTFVAVWEVFDKGTKSRFFICDGYKDYLLEPEEPQPCIQRFWPIIPLSFNDTEAEPGLKVSIYPPSDVRLLMSAQKEYNRCRDGLRRHRRSNKPKYLTAAGWLEKDDKDRLMSDQPYGAVIELVGGLPPGSDVSKMLAPFQHAPIDPAAYDTTPIERDIMLTTGHQQANLGPITKQGTATEATISEQSRQTTASSDVDELDDLLTEMALVGGEMLLREASRETITRDVGPGAAWPQADREPFVNRIFLEVQAASTGRPNKGMETANFQLLAPILQAAGANPQFIVREAVKRLDDRLDVSEAFPIIPPALIKSQSQAPTGPGQSAPADSNAPTPSANNTDAGPSGPLPVPTDAASGGNPS